MYYVYILRSKRNGRFYTGCTNDLRRRLNEHNSGQSTYTKLTHPFDLLHYEEFDALADARKRERDLKGGQGREWIKSNFG